MNELKCNVCGEMNSTDAVFCTGCGAPLSVERKQDTVETVVESLKETGIKSKSAVKNKKKNSSDAKTAEKKPEALSKTTLFYLSFVLVLAAAFILYSSGIFDKPPLTQTQQFGDSNNPGVDLGNLEQINSLESKVKNDPNNKELQLQLAHLLNDSGFKTRAIEEYRKYLKVDSKNADVWVDMGVCYFETGKNQDAINSMERALKIQPRHQIANLDLGIVNMASGNRAIALKYWQKAVEIDSTNEIGRKAKDLIKSH